MMHVALLGPVAPAALSDLLYTGDADQAATQAGNHGPSVSALARGLLGRGCVVTIISHWRGHPPLDVSGDRLRIIQVGSRRSAIRQVLDHYAAERRGIGNYLDRTNCDVVHAHWTYEWAIAALRSKKPTVITIHDAPLRVALRNRSAFSLARLGMAYHARIRMRGNAPVVAAVSPAVSRAWAREMLWGRHISVIPNAIYPVPKARSLPTRDAYSIFELADGGRLKNVRTLLRAFRGFRDDVPEAQLLLAGPGLDPHAEVANWAARQGYDANVDFLGPISRDRAAALMAGCDLHVHASLEESFGLTILEAMANGVPVVAGMASGAVPWLLRNGELGYLADVTDADSLRYEILRAYEHRDTLSAEKAQRARHAVLQGFTASAVADAYLPLYEHALVATT